MTKQFAMSKYINKEEMYKAKAEYYENRCNELYQSLKKAQSQLALIKHDIEECLPGIKSAFQIMTDDKVKDNETNKTTD